MSARKRFRRPVVSRLQRRSVLPILEDLESRLVLSQNGLASSAMGPPASGPPGPVMPPAPVAGKPIGVTSETGRIARPLSSVPNTPPFIIKTVLGPDGKMEPYQSSAPVGYTPAQVRGAYGVNLLTFGAIVGDGAGQTIALIDAYDNPSFADTGTAAYQGSALQIFDKTFNLPDPPSFQKFNQLGGKNITAAPAPKSSWGVEESLDIEWAHSIAPMANIDLVEGNTPSDTDLYTAMETAGTTLGASVISMSFGASLEGFGLGSMEPILDSEYMAPTLAANPNLTLLSSTGDDGSQGRAPIAGPSYPAVSPYVAGIGGTSLFIGGTNNWLSETGWSGSGGGISNVYPETPWQKGIPGSANRTIPDVSAIADPATGVAVCDPYDFGAKTPWIQVGGTSLACPVWAGIIALADQGRALEALPALNGPGQTLPALYGLYTNPTTYAADFHDITVGSNGLYNAGPGYDLVTGIGSPIVNKLVPDLVDYGAAKSSKIEFQPPSDVIAGGFFGTAVQALDAKGNVVNSYEGSATISLVSGPAGANFTPQTVQFSGGTALFNSLSLNVVSQATPYVFQIVVGSQAGTLDTVVTTPVYVTTAATPGVAAYYPVPLDQSLRGDIGSTQLDSEATNDIYLVYSTAFPIVDGQILLQNPVPSSPKLLNFLGQGQSTSVITSDYTNRLFEITGTIGANPSLKVVFQDLTLTGGLATDEADLPLPGILSLGGALVMNGGAAVLSDVAVKSNVALGQTGAAGTKGSFAGPGGPGTNGGVAQGGGIYLAAGSLTLNGDTITGNVASGGLGGIGGKGGPGGFGFSFGGGTTTFFPVSVSGGQGGVGGRGGTAAGGAMYVAGGTLTINGGTVVDNSAQGGLGGTGGEGGRGGTSRRLGGDGGLGGAGAAAAGGAIYLARGSVTVNSALFESNNAAGGVGGAGGAGGKGGGNGKAPSGAGGVGGKGAAASGGGLYLSSGTVTWSDSMLSFNAAQGGKGGGDGSGAGHGQSGSGAGGGIFAAGALNLAGGVTFQNNLASSGGGIYTSGKLTIGAITFSDNSAVFGGAIASSSKLTVNGAIFTGDSATNGGAVFDNAGLVLSSGTFTGDSATNFGGGLAIAGPLSISGGTFSGNSAYAGGAIYTAGSASITGATLTGNSATLGGAVANASTGTLAISNQTFSGNSAADGGAVANLGTLTLSGSTFTGNSATSYGGGLYEDLGTATISKTSFGLAGQANSGNSGNVGGGIGNYGGTLVLSYLTFFGNTATGGYGGGIGSTAVGGMGSVSLSYTTMSGDSAEYGGAISNSALMTITNTTMSGEAASYGGAVQNAGGLTMTNATLAGNTGATAGGGVYNNASGTLTAVNVTIADNSVQSNGAGGGLDAAGGTVSLYNTIVATNTIQGTPATPSDINLSGSATISPASAYNLVGTGGSGTLENGTLGNIVLTSLAHVGLAPLAAYGGQNPTVALLAGSPAIDTGSASIPGVTVPTVDQRGALRGTAGLNAGANPDIGSYEASSSFLVTTSADTTDAGALRSAIAWSDVSFNANPANIANPAPNTVVFNTVAGGAFASPQSIVLTGGTLVLSNTKTGIAISGPGASQVTISGNNAVGVMMVTAGTSATLSGITITAGSAANGAGVNNQGGNVTLMSAAVSLNTSSANGGGIENADGGTLTVINSQIVSNNSAEGGGGISNEAGATLSLSGATITGNLAAIGGGVLNQGTISLTGTTFSGNSATAVGGGLASESPTPFTIQNSIFSANSASDGGGIYAAGTLTVNFSTITGNSATGFGGGIVSTGSLTVASSTLSGNSATGVGGAIDGLGSFAVEQSTVSSNKAGSGGGIAIGGQGTGTITDSNLAGNSATTLGGGGVFNQGSLTVTRSTFSTNAGPSGGAFYNASLSTLGLTNSTLANNTAVTAGAGIYNLAGLTAVNTTIADNNVTAGIGGGLDAVTGVASLFNTIVALNTDGVGVLQAPDDIVGSPVTVASSSAYDLVGAGGSGGLINGNNGNLIGIAKPDLGPLANNGGPMQTIALLAGSPAIDAGSTSIPGVTVPTGDERGAQRGPFGLNAGPTVDIGAYEASSSYVVIATADTGAIGTLRTAAAWANLSVNANPENILNPAPNTVEFNISTTDPGYNPASKSWTITLSGVPLGLTGTNVAESIVGLGPNVVTISGNNASGVIAVGSGVNATITGLTITGGLATAYGGGINNAGSLTASNLVVSGNAATIGGGIANQAGGTLTLTGNVTLTGDSATTQGGGLFNAGSLSLSHSSITGDSALVGGGIYNSGNMLLDQTPVSGNTASSKGGGIANTGTLSITYAALSNNQATGTVANPVASGGAADNSGTLTITNSTLNGNTAATSGGAIENESAGTLRVTNATLAGNSATSGGGLDNNGTSFFVNSTVADNAANGGIAGGLNLESGGRASLYNTIVALNTITSGTSSTPSDIVGFVAAGSQSNLIGTGGSGGLQNKANGNLVNVAAPLLGTLSNNGGPTETIALLASSFSGTLTAGSPSVTGVSSLAGLGLGQTVTGAGVPAGTTIQAVNTATGTLTLSAAATATASSASLTVSSPAIDHGVASILGVTIPTTDERGAVRGPAGLNAGSAPDIGAYEASSSFVVTSPANTLDAGTLPTAVSWADFSTNANPANIAAPAPNTIVFDTTGVFSSPQTINLNGVTLSLSNPSTGVTVNGPGSGIVTVSGNQAGGVFVVPKGATVALSGITITGGSATDGGAVDNFGTLSLTTSTISGNSAVNGGGIDNESGASLTVERSTFSGNTATEGGAIVNSSTATALLVNSTLADNSATTGGAIFNAGTLTAVNVTIAYNSVSSTGTGGGLDQTGGTALLANTIIASNTAGTGKGATPSDIAGTVSSSSSYNLIGSGGSGGLSNGPPGNNQVGVANPGLAPGLGNNGGPTQTIALLLGSPALDAGSAQISGVNVPTIDQRGAVRGSTPDIGAYETSSSYLVTSTADSLNTGTLRSAVIWANSNPIAPGSGPNVIDFDTTGAFSTPQTIVLSPNLGTLALTSTTAPVLINGAAVVSVSGNGAVGVFSIAAGVTVTMDNLTITAGSANSGGGIENGGNLTITDDTFTNNSAVYYGGAIYNVGGVLSVTGTTFTNNAAEFGQGGGIDNTKSASGTLGTLTVANSSFRGGLAFQGGAINNKYGTVTVTGSNLQNNTATEGGGIFNNATASVTGSTIANNIAHDGGGIANDLIGTLSVSNSTIAANSGGNDGGGINSAGISTIVNSTIAYNSVIPGGPGGGIDVASGTTTIYNTIVAENTAGTGTTATPNDVSGTLAAASEYNLIGSTGGGLTSGVDNNIVKPAVVGLGTFGNNGGPLETVSLLSTSPAIDGGANTITGVTIPTIDERGALRGPAGLNAGPNVDIGAYEASSSYLVTTTVDGTTAGTLREAVSWANASSNLNPINVKTPAPNTILFDTTHAFATPQTITLASGPLTLTNTTTPVAITGPSASANAVTISGGGLSGVLSVAAKVKASISYLTITGGSAISVTGAGDGGGIDNFGTLLVTDSTLRNNAAIDGGGIANELGGTLTLVGSTVNNNSGTSGGGIYNVGTLLMTNSTVASNTASVQGGGLFNTGSTQPNGTVLGGVATAVNSTIAYNNVLLGGVGGGIETTTTTAALYNTIVALNTAAAASGTVASDIGGKVATASAYNLIGTGGSGGLTSGTNGNQVLVAPASPGLGTLASNGGPTQTIALQLGSPAIGKGSSTITGVTVPKTDQRGVARPSSSIDIGAYQYSTVAISPGKPQTKKPASEGSGTTSSKLVVGPTSAKPSAGSTAKLHASAKSNSLRRALTVKAKG